MQTNRSNRGITTIAIAALACLYPAIVAAQSDGGRFEAGVQLTSIASGQFDAADVGVGGRFSWAPIALVGLEAEVSFYPGDFPDRVAFSRSRFEGLFGATVGPRLGRVRPFGKLRPGFVTLREAPGPFACILIFPPPLSCTLAAGRTVFALDIGGGVAVDATRRTFVRIDLGDRLLKYPGPAFVGTRRVGEDGFVSHDFRLGVAAGLRF